LAIGPECVFVFVKTYCDVPSGLTHICFVTYGACEFVYFCECVFVSCLCSNLFPMVLLVWNAILMLVCRKMFVINVVSLPVYVNVAHFCFSIGLGSICFLSFRLGGFCGQTGNELFSKMLWMICSSRLCSPVGKSYVFSLLYKNLIAANLCWMGWLDVYGMIMSVNVGFLYMDIFQSVRVL